MCFAAFEDTLGTRAHLILGEAHDRGGMFSTMLMKGELVPPPLPILLVPEGAVCSLLPPQARGGLAGARGDRGKTREAAQGEGREERRPGKGPHWEASKLTLLKVSTNNHPLLPFENWPLLRRRQWHPTPVLLPGKSHGQRSLVGCSPWGR